MNGPTCPKCRSSRVVFEGDECLCLACSKIWYADQPKPEPVPESLKAQKIFQTLSQGVKHAPRPCDVCSRTVLKPTKYGNLCVSCMRWLHAWIKNKSHLKPPPYVRLPDGRWARNPFRALHHKIAVCDDFESILTLSKTLLEDIYVIANTTKSPASEAAQADSCQQPGGAGPELASFIDGAATDPGCRADGGRHASGQTKPAGQPKYPRRYTSNKR